MLATLASDHPGIGYARGEDLDAASRRWTVDIGSAAIAAWLRPCGRYRERNLCDDGVERKRLGVTDVLSSDPPRGVGADHHDRRYRRHLPHHRHPAVAQPQGLALGVRLPLPRVRRRRRRRLRQHAVRVLRQRRRPARASRRTRRSTATPAGPGRPAAAQRRRRPRSPSPTRRATSATSTAKVWLPPQYFTNPRQHFPVVYLLHGNPGRPTDWLTAAGGAATCRQRGPRPATRSSSSCPRSSRTHHRRQPLRRHRVAGERGDLHHQGRHRGDRHQVPHHRQRQGPRDRRSVHGWVLRPQPGPQAPRPVLGRSLDFSGETASGTRHAARGQPGALRRLRTGSRRPTPTAPSKYVTHAGRQQGPGDLLGQRHQ